MRFKIGHRRYNRYESRFERKLRRYVRRENTAKVAKSKILKHYRLFDFNEKRVRVLIGVLGISYSWVLVHGVVRTRQSI